MTIVVTGAGGFLGRNLVAGLLADGKHVRAVGRGGDTLSALQNLGAEIIETNYGPGEFGFLEAADAVVHLAGRRMRREDDPCRLEPFVEPNLRLVERLVDAGLTKGVKRLVMASSIAVYSATDAVPFDEKNTPRPANAYGLSKYLGETLLAFKTQDVPLSAVSLRFSALFGAGERTTGALMRFARQAAAGESIVLHGKVNATIDQLYVDDAVDAIRAALRERDACGPLNIGSGRGWSVGEIAATINAVYDNRAPMLQSEVDNAQANHAYMSIERAWTELSWTPKHTLETGLRAMRAAQSIA